MSEDEAIPEVEQTIFSDLDVASRDVTDISFAEDVLEVYRHINSAYGARKQGYTPSRKFLHDWATKKKGKGPDAEYTNVKEFMTMVKTAEKTVRDSKKGDEDSVIAAEKKPIAELQEWLRGALEEARSVGIS
jgi:hypothetical protein